MKKSKAYKSKHVLIFMFFTSDRERSPRRRKVIFNLEEEDPDKTVAGRARGFDAGLMQREVARQAWLDREAAEQVSIQDCCYLKRLFGWDKVNVMHNISTCV